MHIKSRYEEAIDTQSKYCYPNSDVLINKLNIKDQKDLDVAERRITTLTLTTIQLQKPKKISNLITVKYYLDLHKKVFGPIYNFAGETRNENVSKGNTTFCRPELIYSSLTDTMNRFRHQAIQIKTKDDYTTWLADFYADLNIIHPFREGNGRINREFLRECVEVLSPYLGFNYELDFSNITEQASKYFLDASIISAMTCDNKYLKKFFNSRLKEKQEIKEVKKGR